MRMAEEIAEPERAADYVKAKRKAGEPVTGFGHRVYRTEDPRARHMRQGVAALSARMGEPKWLAILEAVVKCQEQAANNILIRPLTLNDGPEPRDYVPLEER